MTPFNDIPIGVRSWLATLVLAAALPPLVFAWRNNRWRLSLKQLLAAFVFVGPACLLLACDLERIGQVARIHINGITRGPYDWCVLIGLPIAVVFACSAICTRALIRSSNTRGRR